MIDREKRDFAACLIEQFLDGSITSDDLDSEWRSNRKDPAIEAIGSMVWLFYDDFKPRRMVGEGAPLPEELALLQRYAAYLRSDHSYEWPNTNFVRLAGLGLLVPLSLGLLKPFDCWIKARNAKFDARMDAHGDWTVWPYTRRIDWSGEPIPPYIR